MKKTLLGSLILLAFAGNVQAAANADTKGTVTFFGKVVENTCQVKSGHRNMSVTLNDVGKNHLSQQGYTAMQTPFTITLENCNVTTTNNKPKATKVGVYFYSWENADKDNKYTLKNIKENTGTNDSAKKVNIQLLEDNGTAEIKVVGKTTTDFTSENTNGAGADPVATNKHISSLTPLNNQNSINLHYIAQYYATGVAEAGKVQSSVDFQIAYE
ncbi:fimbrial protein [Haemophilus influenzae]|nr:hafa major pilus protein [Haemophilus influenzae]